MPTLVERLQFIVEGGRVERFHTRPGVKPDSDAAHSWLVAMLCEVLTVSPDGPRNILLRAALTHDLGEQYTGDMSSPAKRALNIRGQLADVEASTRDRFGANWEGELTEQESRTLYLADQFAGMLYCVGERELGNVRVNLMMERWFTYMDEMDPQGQAYFVYLAIKVMWAKAQNELVDFDVFKESV